MIITLSNTFNCESESAGRTQAPISVGCSNHLTSTALEHIDHCCPHQHDLHVHFTINWWSSASLIL